MGLKPILSPKTAKLQFQILFVPPMRRKGGFMKRLLSLFLIFSLAFALVSCKVKPSGEPNASDGSTASTDPGASPSLAPTATRSYDVAIYRDTVFYCDPSNGGKIKYQSLDNVQSSGVPLYPSNNKSIFSGVESGTQFMIDPIATEKNGGSPVLYICLKKDYGRSWTLVSFNTKNNEARILKEDMPQAEGFLLYGEYLIYSVYKADSGRTIHSVKTDGTESCALENRYKSNMYPQNVRNGELYFKKGNDLYKAPLSLDSSSLVIKKVADTVFFCDGYMYYTNVGMYPDYEADRHLLRVDLYDTSETETVIDKQVFGITKDSLFLNYELAGHAIYLYNAMTNENKLVYQKKGKKSVACFSENYICFRETSGDEKFILYYDIVAQKEIRIPY